MTFKELKEKIKACKTRKELDALRPEMLVFVPNGGDVNDFEKLQRIFHNQKRGLPRS